LALREVYAVMRIIASTTHRDRGFTLVELLIVIVILGVLSSVSVFAVRGISSRGEASACQADVKTLETAIEVWRVQHPGTDTVSEIDLVQAGHLRSPSTRYDVIDALTIVPTAGGGCVGQTTSGSSSTTTSPPTTSPPTSSPCKPDQWVAEWYSNPALEGSPVAETCEAEIDNTWKYDAPGVKGVPADRFSVRWARTFTAADSGQYAFTAYTDDGIRVLVDGEGVIDSWRDQATTRYDEMVKLGAGEHTVVVEFYENGGEATARVSFTPV
jgi:prepilin-type N-terminal cleavage/methylation domain-containing protein